MLEGLKNEKKIKPFFKTTAFKNHRRRFDRYSWIDDVNSGYSVERTRNSQSQAAIPQSEQVKLNFIQKVAPIAESEQRQSHVLASITIAQAALESDWGQSELSQKYNNLFGVKGTGTNSAMMTTKEYVNGQWITVKASFAVYPSWAASIAAHTKLLVDGLEGDQNHYEQVVNATNYETAAEALQANGYATDPQLCPKADRNYSKI